MLSVESDTKDWSSCRTPISSEQDNRAANGLTETSPLTMSGESQEDLPGALASTESSMPCSRNPREKPVDANCTMRVSPLLHPMAKAHNTNRGMPSPASASDDTTKAASKEQPATSCMGDKRLASAPSTASTTTAEATTKVADTPFRDPSSRKIRASAAMSTFEETQKLAVQGDAGTTTGNSLQIASFASSLSGPCTLADLACASQRVTDRPCSPRQQQAYCNKEQVPQKGPLPLTRAIRRTAGESEEGTPCKGNPYDTSVAGLVAALGASSLRLAAAAEQGLDSSPSDAGGRIWQRSKRVPVPTSGTTATETFHSVSPSIATTKSQTFTQTRRSPITRRVLPAPKATEMNRNRRTLPPPSDTSRRSKLQESPVQTPSQPPATKELLRAGRRSDTIHRKQVANHHYDVDPIFLHTLANGSKNNQTPGIAAQESEMWPCRSPSAVECTRSSNSCMKNSMLDMHTAVTKDGSALSTNIQESTTCDNLCHSPEWHLLARGPHRVETVGQDCASSAYHGEEEHQFSMLLQHSLGLLRREAARCFASSQAFVKQKLWRELQHERHLRLQLQQEHQVRSAAAQKELVALRAQQAVDYERLDKIMEICCRRKRTDESCQLLRFAWKGWQLHRVLTWRLKQLQTALQQRHLFMLQLRAFLPWRAAAARRTLEQHMQRAQRLLQQEIQRIGQAHVESAQKHQMELQQLQKQLNSEIHLRECLQQSLIGLVTRGGIGASPQGVRISSPSESVYPAPAPSSGIHNEKRQQRPKPRENRTRQEKILSVVGTQSNIRCRPTPTSHNNSRQQQDEKLPLTDCSHKKWLWHWLLQNAGLGGPAPLQPTFYKFDSRATREITADAGRRVKFANDQEVQQQHNQQQNLMLLANLLSDHFSQRQNYSGAAREGPAVAQACCHEDCSSSRLASPSAPNYDRWDLFPDISFSEKNATAVRRGSCEGDSLTHRGHTQTKARLGEKHNYFISAQWNPSHFGSSGVECHPHKQRSWTSAGQFTPAV